MRLFEVTWRCTQAAALSMLTLGLCSISAAQLPTRVTGKMDYQNYIIPKYFKTSPSVALIDVSGSILKSPSDFFPVSSQVLGRLTSPIEKSPFSFEIGLPVEPTGQYVDLDFNGKSDKGVQVFAAVVATNLFGDGYLEQVEQNSGFYSLLRDSRTGQITQGTLLIYAPDDRQQIPAGSGKDGRVFTSDDPVAYIQKGYSVMDIGADGSVTMRYGQLEMSLLEEKASETPDFSSKGILQSFDSLLELLTQRYAYKEFHRIDWTATRARFRPLAVELDKTKNVSGYSDLLRDLAFSFKDGHVNAITPYALKMEWFKKLGELWSGNVGVSLARLSDGRVCVTALRPNSAAANAGWRIGTEIVKVGGKSISERLADIPQFASSGIEERIEEIKMRRLISFPIGTKMEVEYRLPGESTLQKATLTTEAGDEPSYPTYPRNVTQPFSYEFLEEGAIGYVQWRSFESPNLNIANWEHFLASMAGRPGMIIDLRGNGGGLETLYYTMASYLFSKEKPAPVKWSDRYEFNGLTNKFELARGSSNKIYSPREELAFSGKVIILVDSGTASSAEFFSKYLQVQGRARVIAESSTDGAGGSMRQVLLPEKIVFTYTGGQIYKEGTKVPIIEGIGVKADLRIPISLENEAAKFAGHDVVLEAAVKLLAQNSRNRESIHSLERACAGDLPGTGRAGRYLFLTRRICYRDVSPKGITFKILKRTVLLNTATMPPGAGAGSGNVHHPPTLPRIQWLRRACQILSGVPANSARIPWLRFDGLRPGGGSFSRLVT